MSDLPPTTATPYTPEDRRILLDEYFQLLADLEAIPSSNEASDRMIARLSTLWDKYLDGTPHVALARCPFTGEIFAPAIDHHGLDGLFWKFDPPAREPERMTGTRIAFTGAVSLTEPVESAPFLVKPGPGAPFVVPRILRHPNIRAVLAAVPIGRHTGYAITYFASEPLTECERFNTWGTDDYQLDLGDGNYGWNRSEATAADYDFGLAPWIQQGKLLWMAPGDETCTLHEGLAGCPYLSLPGNRTPVCIQDGDVWDSYVAASDAPDDDDKPTPTITCPDCQAINDSNAKFCCDCGRSITRTTTCTTCGTPVKPGTRYCSNCGTKLT